MLERDAQLLIRGTDAYGRKEKEQTQPSPMDEPNRVLIPIMVTNAKLFSASYDPSNVSLETGQLPMTPEPDIAAIEWVRFRKAFTTTSRDVGEEQFSLLPLVHCRDSCTMLTSFPIWVSSAMMFTFNLSFIIGQ